MVQVNESDEYQEGYLSFLEGLTIKQCPYAIKDICKRWDWLEGFVDSRDSRSNKKAVKSYA